MTVILINVRDTVCITNFAYYIRLLKWPAPASRIFIANTVSRPRPLSLADRRVRLKRESWVIVPRVKILAGTTLVSGAYITPEPLSVLINAGQQRSYTFGYF